MKEMQEILRKVLEKIKPTPEEERKLEQARKIVLDLLEKVKSRFSFEKIVFAGSSARGTHLRGRSDIDVFILYPKTVDKSIIEKEIKELSKELGGEMRYAQHPYFKLKVEGVDVEVVPAYEIKPGDRVLSATDRTPLHNQYVKEKLEEWQKDEVRLLKAFMKGIGVYGAEIKVEGFSGYLCELLIIHYGDFISTLKAASHWKWGEIIDIEGHGKVKEKRPLIVVDPVDPYRNVAHTVSKDSMATFIVASREFLKRPSIKFFFPEKPVLPPSKIKDILERRKSRLVGVFVKYPEGEAPDNLWGQLKKFGRRLAKKLEERDNILIQWDVWSDEKEYAVVLVEVGGRYTARLHLREGPPVTNEEHAERFLEKHKKDAFGPFIKNGRLIAFFEVEEKSLIVETAESVEEISKEKSIGGGLGKEIERWVDIVEGRGVLKYYKVEGFPSFISHFLLRKFPWEY